jgi:mannosyltransferase
MATYASRPAWDVKVRTATRARAAAPAALLLVVLVSVLLRIQELGIGFWIDEGISVGIADRPLVRIPGVLREDGSPPLYYLLLHGWIQVFGTSEGAVRALSLVFATLAVPAAWWAGRVLFGARAGWMAAVLAATNPFLTTYAQEARMYALMALLGVLACGCLGRVLAPGVTARERRPWALGAAVALAAMLYTHNWALFFGAAWGGAWLVLLARARGDERRALLQGGLIAFGGAIVLWLPWVPTVLYQVAHTGAPWSQAPDVGALLGVPGKVLGTMAQGVLALTAGAGVAALLQRREGEKARTALVLLAVGVVTVLLAWLASQASPAWAARYLAVGVGPFVLAAAAGLAYAGRLGIAGLIIVTAMGLGNGAPSEKSNVKDVAEAVAPSLRRGDVVVVTQPEQVPVLHYYLPRGLRFATLTGPVGDVGVTDWRDGVQRLRASSAARDLQPLMDRLAPGRRLALVEPIFSDEGGWEAPWLSLVRSRSYEWEQQVSNDARFRVVTIEPPPPNSDKPGPIPVQATVYVKESRP